MSANIVQEVIDEKFADNAFRAAAIVNGLKLFELKTHAERLVRLRLYRDWRVSGIYGKKTAPCFAEAINGRAVPILSSGMFEELEAHERA